MLRKIVFIFLLLISLNKVFSQNSRPPFYYLQNTAWTDTIIKNMTLDEKIGQLFMVAAYSNKGESHINEIKKLIEVYKIGGLIFMQGGPIRQANLYNNYQKISKVPLMIGMDAEWGLSMRLDSTFKFPYQMTLGAISNDKLIYEMGKSIAKHCKRLGVQVNFAPVVDINSNPNNPIIGFRSFGENKYDVAEKGILYMKGMQDIGILANAKHFPGHGDTDKDSHQTLPVVPYKRKRIDTLELYPFRKIFEEGIGSVMVAHLYVPCLDKDKDVPTTLSPKVVTKLLKNEMSFKGLVFTDALNMKGVSSLYKPGEADLNALLAGNDVLLFSEDVPLAIEEIKKAIEKGKINEEEIDERCRKILLAKQWSGLDKNNFIEEKNLYNDLNNVESKLLNRKIYEEAITLVKNEKKILPIKNLENVKFASLVFESNKLTPFQKSLERYTGIKHFNFTNTLDTIQEDSLVNELTKYDVVFISIENKNRWQKNLGMSDRIVNITKRIADKTNTILTLFTVPYAFKWYGDYDNFKGIIVSYQNDDDAQDITAQMIFGAIDMKGKLPVTINEKYKYGFGLNINKLDRLKYTIPEEIGLSSLAFNKIDSIVYDGIYNKALPGCQVLVAKGGKVIYNKSFGYHTYENSIPVDNNNIYDLASVTKISASTIALMKLVELNSVDLDDKLHKYLDYVKQTNKKGIVIRDMMAHQAKLQPTIFFYKSTIDKGVYEKDIYSNVKTDYYNKEVAKDLFISSKYKDIMYQEINDSKLLNDKEYKYSDVGYYYLLDIIEKTTKTSLDNYLDKIYYSKLGMSNTAFNPIHKFELDKIVPTENDTVFRKQLIHGYVHDPGAAMLGGVAGHAGLFSNANDMAKLMQMLLNGGKYAGYEYLKAKTIDEFTQCQFPKNNNRRAIGFDKPVNVLGVKSTGGPTCEDASILSYGHSGFTGTMIWVDPKNDLIYIFLSNRVYPDAENNKLLKMNIRTNIQQVIYDIINRK